MDERVASGAAYVQTNDPRNEVIAFAQPTTEGWPGSAGSPLEDRARARRI
jgi:hypothetical protein